MALRKVEGAFCRIRMVLPNGQSEVTIGSGCIVYSESLLSHFPDQPAASRSGDAYFILTSKQVFGPAKANRNSKNSFKVEFFKKGDRKLLEYPLDLSYSRELPGRVLGQSEDAEYLTVIPVGHLVTKNIFKKILKLTLATDRFLGCRRESAENLKSLLSSQQLFCYVCCDSGFSRFDFEAFYLKLDGDNFSLNPVSERPELIRKESDFNREAKPCGALLMNTDGECVGVLTLSSQERKILPLFLPLHEEKRANTEISRTQGQTWQEVAESAAGACNIESTVSGSVPSFERLSECRTYSEGQRSGDTCRNNTAGAVSLLTDLEPEIGDKEIENEENRSRDSSNSQSDTQPQDDGSIYYDDHNGSYTDLPSLETRNNTASAVSSLTDWEPEISENEENRSQDSSNSEADTWPQDDGSICDDHNGSCKDLRSLETRESSFEENTPVHGTQNELHLPDENSLEMSYTDTDRDEKDRSSNFPKLESVDPHSESKLRYDPVGAPADRNGNISSTRSKGYLQRLLSEPPNVSQALATVSRPSPSRSLSTNSPTRDRIEPGSSVVQKIVNDVEVMRVLALHLNRMVGYNGVYVARSCLDFAHEYKVPKDVMDKCQTISSPSWEMFQYICTMETVTIKMLKEHIQPGKGNRRDVLDELNKSESENVRELCAKEPHILGRICLSLDCGHYNWRSLGQALEIAPDTLEQFDGSSEAEPAKVIFEILKTKSPQMKITEIKAILKERKRDDVCKELLSFKDDDTVSTLVRNADVLSKITRLLGKNIKGANNWEQFALCCGISQEFCNSLKPSCDANPIKSVLEYITHRDPYLNMASFLKTLEKIERNDVLDALGQFFYELPSPRRSN